MDPSQHDLVVPLLPVRPPAVLFPSQIPLRIGRPRSRNAIVAASDSDVPVLVAGLQRHPDRMASLDDYHPIGICLEVAHVASVSGGLGIHTLGRARVHIQDVAHDPEGDHLIAGVRVLDWGDAPGTPDQVEAILGYARLLQPDPAVYAMLRRLRNAPGVLADAVAAHVLGPHLSRHHQLELLAVPVERRVEATRLALHALF